MIPTGPSPCTKGIRFSSSIANIKSGREKARVLPDPVNAIPIISLPENLDECRNVSTLRWASCRKRERDVRYGNPLELDRSRSFNLFLLEVIE